MMFVLYYIKFSYIIISLYYHHVCTSHLLVFFLHCDLVSYVLITCYTLCMVFPMLFSCHFMYDTLCFWCLPLMTFVGYFILIYIYIYLFIVYIYICHIYIYVYIYMYIYIYTYISLQERPQQGRQAGCRGNLGMLNVVRTRLAWRGFKPSGACWV